MRHDKVGHFTNAEQDATTATERRSGKVEHAEPERLAGQPVSDQAVRCGGSIGDDLRLTVHVHSERANRCWCCPGIGAAGAVGEVADRIAELLAGGPPEGDGLVLAGLAGGGSSVLIWVLRLASTAARARVSWALAAPCPPVAPRGADVSRW
jgi:hypothetical protein